MPVINRHQYSHSHVPTWLHSHVYLTEMELLHRSGEYQTCTPSRDMHDWIALPSAALSILSNDGRRRIENIAELANQFDYRTNKNPFSLTRLASSQRANFSSFGPIAKLGKTSEILRRRNVYSRSKVLPRCRKKGSPPSPTGLVVNTVYAHVLLQRKKNKL